MVLNCYPPRSSVPTLLAVLPLLLCSSVFFGPISQGTITDLVTDSSGAIMPSVTVTIKNPDANFTYKGPGASVSSECLR